MEKAIKLGILRETSNGLRVQMYLNKKFDTETNEMIDKDEKMIFHTADFMDNKFANAIGTREIKELELNFTNPKPRNLLKALIDMTTKENDLVMDFFAGSGTTAHAVMELNREDGGNRQCILVTNNEKTEINPNGIAYDVTSKRLKRIMCGECYDGTKDFKWLEKNKPYGENLEVYDIKSATNDDKKIFEKIDEKLYDKDFKGDLHKKIEWICEEFEITCKCLEEKE